MVAIVSAVNACYVRDVKMICEIGNLKLNFFQGKEILPFGVCLKGMNFGIIYSMIKKTSA